MPPRATASIVELSAFRRRPIAPDRPRAATAELLSMRRSLGHEASVEIEGLEALGERLGETAAARASRRVRALLDREFGALRVHRVRRRFVVRHRSGEALVAGLLRVQFHARGFGTAGRAEGVPLSITWGVGRSAPEAELERLRRRRRGGRR